VEENEESGDKQQAKNEKFQSNDFLIQKIFIFK